MQNFWWPLIDAFSAIAVLRQICTKMIVKEAIDLIESTGSVRNFSLNELMKSTSLY